MTKIEFKCWTWGMSSVEDIVNEVIEFETNPNRSGVNNRRFNGSMWSMVCTAMC